MGRKIKRKTARQKLIKELDALWAEAVKKRDKYTCQYCGTTKDIQAAHIFPRSNMSVRWDLDNGIALCVKHHLFWAHRNPIEFIFFIERRLGREKLEELSERARFLKKYTLEELIALQDYLKKINEGGGEAVKMKGFKLAKVQEWQVRKIEEMRKQGKKYSEISFEVGISPEMVRYICNNIQNYKRSFAIKEEQSKTKVENSVAKGVAKGFVILKLEISSKDYLYFMKIKEEIESRLANVSEEYVFYKLLDVYKRYKEIEKENKKLRAKLQEYICAAR